MHARDWAALDLPGVEHPRLGAQRALVGREVDEVAVVLRLAASTGYARSSVALRGESRNKGNAIVVAGGGAVFVGGEFAGDAAFGSPPLRSDGRPPDGFVARLSV